MYHLNFHGEIGFLHASFKGKINIDNIRNFYDAIIGNDSYPARIKLLTDYRLAMSSDYDLDGMSELINYANTNLSTRYEQLQWANLSLSPIHTTAATIFSQGLTASNIEYGYFTSIERAIKFLSLSDSDKQKLRTKGIILG